MKQTKELGRLISGISLSLSIFLGPVSAKATSFVGQSCPQKFVATVINIEDVQSATFPKVEVDFQVIQTLKGEQITSKKIQVVKGGPVQFKNGEVYTIESRENWLCSATLFSKI